MRFFTWLLAFVVLFVAVRRETRSKELFGLAVGLCVLLAGLSAGRVSGALLNPAVAVGVAASSGAVANGVRYCGYQLVGGAVAGGMALLCREGGEEKGEASKLLGAA